MVSTRVSHNQETGLSESCLDLIGECTGGEPTVEGGGTGGGGELQHSSLNGVRNKLLRMSQIQILTDVLITHINVAQVTIKLQSWDNCPNGVSENPAGSLSHSSDTGTPTSVPGFNRVLILACGDVNGESPHHVQDNK